MNGSIIRYILGYILKTEGILMLLPCLIGLIYQESEGWYYLLIATLCFLLGILSQLHKPQNTVFYLKEGCVATAMSWITLSLFGCLPFFLSGEIPSFTNAVFETVSGFTTTGASVVNDVEALSHCTNLWRCFTHWIGGMGVLVFILAIIPMSGGSPINLMRAESPGPSVGKLVPKVKATARILYLIYLVMTIIEFIFLIAGRMPVFDALCTSFGTAGTGGFGIKADSFAGYSTYLQWVVGIFMALFGINFNFYYYIIYKKYKKAITMEEVRIYLFIIVVAVTLIFAELLKTTSCGIGNALTLSFFQVSSVMTSTGYSSADYDTWTQTSKTIIVLLMFIGACAGSTGGGIKVSRIAILFKTIKKELGSYIHPKSIKKINFEGKMVEHDVVRSINVYFITFMIIFAVSVLAISFEGKDMITNFTAVLATINNIGPGLALVGPARNFDVMSVPSKWVLIFDMLAGRLELFPILILFHPTIWKDYATKLIRRHSKKKLTE